MASRLACLVIPGQSLHDAAPVLAVVAAFVNRNDLDSARVALRTVDVLACDRYWNDCGREGLRRHRAEAHAGRQRARRRNVSRGLKVELGNRDGWRCRYCHLRVVYPGFFSALAHKLPEQFPDAPAPIEGTAWPVYRVFDASPDHVVPVSAGGQHTKDNLVTACGACNYQAKGDCTLDELGLPFPDLRPPNDDWNGLLDRR